MQRFYKMLTQTLHDRYVKLIISLHSSDKIYVTHDQVEAMTMADRIMVLHDSKIQQIGTPLEIYNHPANTFVAEFFGTPRMNLLEATYDARLNKLVVDESLEFDCEDSMDRDDYIVGVRPSGFSVEKAADRSNARVVNADDFF